MNQPASKDWPGILERLLAGDRRAYLELARLITGFLAQLRAYDFRDEWDDLRQEVLASLVANARAGRLRDPQAFVGYAKIVTRNKFVDRLKRELRHGGGQSLPWDEETARAPAAWPESEASRALWSAVAELPEESRRIVEGVYREGHTYQEMSEMTGIPLGTLKRRLGESLAFLRRRLAEEAGDG